MTIELSPHEPDDERPSDYASLAAEQVDLYNVINELLSRLPAIVSTLVHPANSFAHRGAPNDGAALLTSRSPA